MVASYEELLNLEERMGIVNRGATTEIIERNTLPHKYKKLKIFVVEENLVASAASTSGGIGTSEEGATGSLPTSSASGLTTCAPSGER